MNCNNCYYHQENVHTSSGYCMYFESIGKEKKEIPLDIADKGCNFFKVKMKEHPLFKYAMELFKGEVI